ncbi:PIG-L family deacetylase [soil metagenome]|jgi:LmbE family N-acetylglucosaminyl deacetylase|nr:PIG-L family deacetylase [Deinococcota bacterium]
MRIMAIFAHPDDELGCLGTLRRHAERGDAVMLVWTTLGELASQFGDASREEVSRVRQEHGAWVAHKVGAEHRFFDMGDSRMTGSRAEALEIARLYARWQPDSIITWSDDHPHPDHRMTAKVSFDAVTLARIPKIINDEIDDRLEAHRRPVRFYQYPSSATIRPVMHVDISEQIGLVSEAFAFYRDFYRWEWTEEQFRASRASHGREVGVKFAEKFQLRQAFGPATDYLL